MLSWIEIPLEFGKECTYCRSFLTGRETGICNTCREDLQRRITKTSYGKTFYKTTGTNRRNVTKEVSWLQDLRTANVEEIKEVSELKAFLNKYFLQNGVDMTDIDKYCRLKKITFESFISNLKSKIKKFDDYDCNYTDNLIKLFYFRNEGASPLELLELFQKCFNDQKFLNDQEFLYSYFFQYKIKMEDIVQHCKYVKQINLESFISDLKSKIKKLYDTEYNYSGRKRVKIGVKKLIQLFYRRYERESRLKCIELFQNCLDDYFEKFKQCKQECMVNIMRLRDEDIEQHVEEKKLRLAKEESQKSDSHNLTSSASEKGTVKEAHFKVTGINEPNLEFININKANLDITDINETNLDVTNIDEANLETTDINETNLEVTGRNEQSNSNNLISFVYEGNVSTNNSDDQSDENALNKKRNASKKKLRPHLVSKNNKIEDRLQFLNEVASDFLKIDFSQRQSEYSFSKKDIVSKKIGDLDNNTHENNNNEKFLITSKSAEVSVKRTSDITAAKTSSAVHTNDIKDDASSRAISNEQIDGNVQKEKKSRDLCTENGSKNEILQEHDIDAQKNVQKTEISGVISQKTSSEEDNKDVSSKMISVEQTDGNMQKERKSGDFSTGNDTRKKGSKNEILQEHDIDAQKIIQKAEISCVISQKASSVVCEKDIKDVSSNIICVEQTDGNMQKERKSGDFSTDNDTRKKGSKNEILPEHDIDEQKITQKTEISGVTSQKTSSVVCEKDIKDVSSKIICVEQTDGNMQKERKLGDFIIDNNTRKKGSKNEILPEHDIDAQKIIQKAEISGVTSQKTSSVVCEKDIKDVSSKIICVEQTDGNMQKERKSGDFSIDNDTRKKCSKNEILPEHDIDAQKIILKAENSGVIPQKTSSVICEKDIKDVSSKIISVEQSDGNMQKERKSGDFSTDNDIRKKGSKNETLEKHDVGIQKIIKNAEMSDITSQKASSACKNDIKEDLPSRIISVEQTDGNMQKERKLGDFSIDNDTRNKGSKNETLLKYKIDAQKIKKNIEILGNASQKMSSVVCKNDIKDMSSRVTSVEQTDDNIQKERKSGFNIDNAVRKKVSKNETLFKHDIDTMKIIKNAEISGIVSQKSSSVVCKNEIKEDASSRIISLERTDGNMQKERKSLDLSTDNDTRNKGSKNETILKHDIDAQKIIKSVEISGSSSQKISSVVCKNNIKDMSSRVISVGQTNDNMQKERTSEEFNVDNTIRKKGSKKETFLKHDIDTQKIIKNAEISDITSQKASSVCKNDIKEMSSRVISVEQTDDNIKKERKSGEFNIDNAIRKKVSKNETLLKHDIQKIIKTEISGTISQKTSSVICKNDLKDVSSRIISVEQTDGNMQKERKSTDFNIDNDIRKEGSKNETLLKDDIDIQKIIKRAEISVSTSQKMSSVVCKNDIKGDALSRVISVEQMDENRQKKRKREDLKDLKNKDNASQRLTDSSKNFRIETCTHPRLASGNDTENYAPPKIISYYQKDKNSQKKRKSENLNKDNALSVKDIDMESKYFLNAVVINNKISVSILRHGDQNAVKVSTERNDSKFISDGKEKTIAKIYEFVFNFKKSGSLSRNPDKRTSYSMISGDPTGQSTGPPRIIYRSEISFFIPDRQMPSKKDCIDFLTKNWYQYVDKASEKLLLKNLVLRISPGTSKDKDLNEDELRSKKQEDIQSRILRLFGYEKKPIEQELRDKQEVIKEKISHSFISTPSDDVSHVSGGQSQNSNSGIPPIAQDEYKSIFSKKSKPPDKSKEVSSVNLSLPSNDKYDFFASPDKEVIPELMEEPGDTDPMVQNKKQSFQHISIEDLLKEFKLDDDETHSSHILSANVEELYGQNYAKSSQESDSICHNYETASDSGDSDVFSFYADIESVFDVSPNLLDEFDDDV